MTHSRLAIAAGTMLLLGTAVLATGDDDPRVERGFRIAPVPLHFQAADRRDVGLGSYLVNAVASCNDCHTCPSFKPGHNPYAGQGTGVVNPANYLAGGVPFGPGLQSANITPDPVTGRPENHRFSQFLRLIRTGHDPDDGHILQVMPWPILRHMTDDDLHAIYEYLKAIPHAEPGSCAGPGQ